MSSWNAITKFLCRKIKIVQDYARMPWIAKITRVLALSGRLITPVP
jgi:hypothetical protein